MRPSRLTFICKTKDSKAFYECSCGAVVEKRIFNVKRDTFSCGCLAAELRKTRKHNARRLTRHRPGRMPVLAPIYGDTAISLSGAEYQRCEQGDFPLYEFFIDGAWWTGVVPEPTGRP